MLKDIFAKKKNNNKKANDKMKTIMDGYVDIKAYKHFPDGTKKLIYHDTGDNAVTDWTRQIIMLLLSGHGLSYTGSPVENFEINNYKEKLTTKPYSAWHTTTTNYDGYVLNGNQFLWDGTDKKDMFYPISGNSKFYNVENELFALFPTKILLGTGCEYTDWENLKEDNELKNTSWYEEMVENYGGEDEAETNFNNLVCKNEDSNAYTEYKSNIYSATVGAQGVYSGNSSLLRAVTVNDPDTSTSLENTADMSKRYGVVGAIKTFYNGENESTYLSASISDSGRLIKPKFRGAGRPCFIYFNRTSLLENEELDWDKTTADISVQKDTSSPYLNRLSFRVVIPSQSSGNSSVGVYCPFNGYTFKQIGLFNDSYFNVDSSREVNNSNISNNMPSGTLIAIKNIQNFSKTADESVEFTWTLTI